MIRNLTPYTRQQPSNLRSRDPNFSYYPRARIDRPKYNAKNERHMSTKVPKVVRPSPRPFRKPKFAIEGPTIDLGKSTLDKILGKDDGQLEVVDKKDPVTGAVTQIAQNKKRNIINALQEIKKSVDSKDSIRELNQKMDLLNDRIQETSGKARQQLDQTYKELRQAILKDNPQEINKLLAHLDAKLRARDARIRHLIEKLDDLKQGLKGGETDRKVLSKKIEDLNLQISKQSIANRRQLDRRLYALERSIKDNSSEKNILKKISDLEVEIYKGGEMMIKNQRIQQETLLDVMDRLDEIRVSINDGDTDEDIISYKLTDIANSLINNDKLNRGRFKILSKQISKIARNVDELDADELLEAIDDVKADLSGNIEESEKKINEQIKESATEVTKKLDETEQKIREELEQLKNKSENVKSETDMEDLIAGLTNILLKSSHQFNKKAQNEITESMDQVTNSIFQHKDFIKEQAKLTPRSANLKGFVFLSELRKLQSSKIQEERDKARKYWSYILFKGLGKEEKGILKGEHNKVWTAATLMKRMSNQDYDGLINLDNLTITRKKNPTRNTTEQKGSGPPNRTKAPPGWAIYQTQTGEGVRTLQSGYKHPRQYARRKSKTGKKAWSINPVTKKQSNFIHGYVMDDGTNILM